MDIFLEDFGKNSVPLPSNFMTMTTDFIPLEQTGFFSALFSDYINQKKELSDFYNLFPTIENFKKQISQKQKNYSEKQRQITTQSIENQYKTNGVPVSNLTQNNLKKLAHPNTFTITTGHQLSLFTGELYFVYKIISAIKLTQILNEKYPEFHFVPVYWAASEDHDFQEINHLKIREKTLRWESPQTGMVGDFSTADMDDFSTELKKELGGSEQGRKLYQLFEDSYLKTSNLAQATFHLVNALFGKYGLVIIDGNQKELKQSFIPYMENELTQHTGFEQVTKTIQEIQKTDNRFSIQVNPREINLFYLTQGGRNRIVRTEKGYSVLNTNIDFSENEMLKELHNSPEKFSPNVILRPLYQEVTLPNLCYIGGAGELAYWLELKRFFDASQIVFPMLLPRNSVVCVRKKTQEKLAKLQISAQQMFLKNSDLEKLILERKKNTPLNLSELKITLKKQFEELYQIAEQTHSSFKNLVKAQETKQINGLNSLENRLLKAQKKFHSDEIERILSIKNEIFPSGNLQERTQNFSEFMIDTQGRFIDDLLNVLNPLNINFSIVSLEN